MMGVDMRMGGEWGNGLDDMIMMCKVRLAKTRNDQR